MGHLLFTRQKRSHWEQVKQYASRGDCCEDLNPFHKEDKPAK